MNDKTRELMFSSDETEYGTPKELFDHYDSIYHFTLDVCATAENTKVPENYFTKEQNCLVQDWGENICWMNPPYNKPESPCPKDESKCKKKACQKRGYHVREYVPGQVDFVAKAADAAKKGALVVCLLPSRTDTTDLFHRYIWDTEKQKPRRGVKVEFVKGRIVFDGAKDPAPFPSIVVIFKPRKRRKGKAEARA